jgi:DNA-binding IclR family transcriptional regulator
MARPALSAARAVQVLNFLAAHSTETFTLSELVRRTGVNVASMHAILAVLEEAEYIVRDGDARTYALGPMLVPVGLASGRRHQVIGLARDRLRAIVDDLDATGLVVGATATEMVILDEVSTTSTRVPSTGQRIRMVPPMGAVFMAWADKNRVGEWVATGPTTTAQSDRLDQGLALVRSRGYAIGLETTARHGMRQALRDLQEEPGSRRARVQLRRNVTQLGDLGTVLFDLDDAAEYDLGHVAAPVFGPHDEVAISIYLVGLRGTHTGAEAHALGQRLRSLAADITAASRDDDRSIAMAKGVW